MSLVKIAWRSLQQRALASTLTSISMALGVALVACVLVIYAAINESFQNAPQGYNLIVGAKGSKLQLVLNTVYHLSSPIENLPYAYYKEFTEGRFAPYVEKVVPVCLGDNFEGYRVVGTVPEMFQVGPQPDAEGETYAYRRGRWLRYEFAEGRNFRHDGFFEAVIGAEVARRTGLKVGSTFRPTHGVADELGHEHDAFTVVGVLRRTGTPNDRALFVNMEGFYLLEGHAKPLQQPEQAGHSRANQSSGHANAHAPRPDQEHADTEDSDHADAPRSDHDHAGNTKPAADDAEPEHAEPHRDADQHEGSHARAGDEHAKHEATEQKHADPADSGHERANDEDSADEHAAGGGSENQHAGHEHEEFDAKDHHHEEGQLDNGGHENGDHENGGHEDADHENGGHEDADHKHADHNDADHENAHHESGGHQTQHKHEGHKRNGHDHHEHQPLPESQREVTALWVRTGPTGANLANTINEGRDAQAVVPLAEIYDLFQTVIGPAQTLLLVLTVLIVVVAGVGILVSMYNSMNERRREIAIMRSLGARRTTVLAIVLLESLLLSLGGGLLGVVAGHGLMGLISPWIDSVSGVSISSLQFEAKELMIIPGLVLLSVVVGFLPALDAYRTDVAKALSSSP